MDDAVYMLAVNRQSGLSTELNTIAHNIANIDTPGFRREGVVFREFVDAAPAGPSLSMADLAARYANDRPGELRLSANALDLAIEGEGYFALDTGEAMLLTRAGAFQRDALGFLVSPDGHQVLGVGGAPIFLPAGNAPPTVAADGTVSVDGEPVGQVAVMTAPAAALSRISGAAFVSTEEPVPVAVPRIQQGALEGSNVDAVTEIARMIEVTRAYERVQALIEDEDRRISDTIETLGSRN